MDAIYIKGQYRYFEKSSTDKILIGSISVKINRKERAYGYIKTIAFDKNIEFIKNHIGSAVKVIISGDLRLDEYEGKTRALIIIRTITKVDTVFNVNNTPLEKKRNLRKRNNGENIR